MHIDTCDKNIILIMIKSADFRINTDNMCSFTSL